MDSVVKMNESDTIYRSGCNLPFMMDAANADEYDTTDALDRVTRESAENGSIDYTYDLLGRVITRQLADSLAAGGYVAGGALVPLAPAGIGGFEVGAGLNEVFEALTGKSLSNRLTESLENGDIRGFPALPK